MTQVNLLPREVRTRRRVRRVTAAAVGAVGAVVVLLLAVFVLQSTRLHKVDSQLGAAQSLNSGLQGKVAQLQKFEDLKKNVAARQAIVDGLLHQQVLWSQVLQDMSAAMPGGVFVTTLTGTLQAGADATGTVGATGAVVGNISLQGTALDYPDLTALLRRLERIDGWVNPWVSQATRAILDGQRVVQFTATVDQSPDATVDGRAK